MNIWLRKATRRWQLGILFPIFLLAGCGGYYIDRLQPGHFTKGDALAQWGAPTYEGLDRAAGLRVMTWRRRTINGDPSLLAMWFDSGDRMVRWNVEPSWTSPAWGY